MQVPVQTNCATIVRPVTHTLQPSMHGLGGSPRYRGEDARWSMSAAKSVDLDLCEHCRCRAAGRNNFKQEAEP